MKEPIMKVGFLLLINALMEYVLQLRSAGSNPIGIAYIAPHSHTNQIFPSFSWSQSVGDLIDSPIDE
jgi:hypothetical protein